MRFLFILLYIYPLFSLASCESSLPIEELIKQGIIYRDTGQYVFAKSCLTAAIEKSTQEENLTQRVHALIALSDSFRILQQIRDAEKLAAEAFDLVMQPPTNAILQAEVLNHQANLMSLYGIENYKQAFQKYEQALQLVSHNSYLSLAILLNYLQSQFNAHQSGEVLLTTDFQEKLKQLYIQLLNLEDSAEKASKLLQIGKLISNCQHNPNLICSEKTLEQTPSIVYQTALSIAHHQKDFLVETFALGYLGEFYLKKQDNDAARQYTQRAIFLAQQINAIDLLYQWTRQLADIYAQSYQQNHQSEDLNNAISQYQLALSYLSATRTQRRDIIYGADANYKPSEQDFRQTGEGETYYKLITLLLEKEDNPVNFIKILEWFEKYKTSELADYLNDDCVIQRKSKLIENEESGCNLFSLSSSINLPEKTALYYPIVLKNKIEIFLLKKEKEEIIIKHKTIEIADIKNIVAEFTSSLGNKNFYGKTVNLSQQLYNLLILPIEKELEGIKTLIIIPDTELQSLPFSALSSDRNFLIEKEFSIIVSPTFLLRQDTYSFASINQNILHNKILLVGISKPMNFPSDEAYEGLDYVPNELEAIQLIYNTDLLLNENFTNKTLTDMLENNSYQIIHIASHGIFTYESENNFILAYQQKIAATEFERWIKYGIYRSTPVELLTLSACSSAKNNNKLAVLGIAGLALKTGARSALASLWKINDQSTCLLMSEFYANLKKTGNKAKSLRNAQLALLKKNISINNNFCTKSNKDFDYSAPYYWGAFILLSD